MGEFESYCHRSDKKIGLSLQLIFLNASEGVVAEADLSFGSWGPLKGRVFVDGVRAAIDEVRDRDRGGSHF